MGVKDVGFIRSVGRIWYFQSPSLSNLQTLVGDFVFENGGKNGRMLIIHL